MRKKSIFIFNYRRDYEFENIKLEELNENLSQTVRCDIEHDHTLEHCDHKQNSFEVLSIPTSNTTEEHSHEHHNHKGHDHDHSHDHHNHDHSQDHHDHKHDHHDHNHDHHDHHDHHHDHDHHRYNEGIYKLIFR